MPIALVHYHEIGLKGLNRGSFERRLEHNVRWALRDVAGAHVRRIASRLLVRVPDGAQNETIAAISRTPGVAYVGWGAEVPLDAALMARTAVSLAEAEIAACGAGARTFAIDARRSATDYPERSMAMNRRIGEAVRIATGLEVDLAAPDITIRVAVVQNAAYLYAHKVPGCGGLPVGTSGRVVALLSAGIDSPVAAWRIMRRGATVIGVHFSGRPVTAGASEHAVEEIARVLSRGGGMGPLYVVPFGDAQRTIALGSPPDLRVLLYRRFMVRVAERIASREQAKALVTGESLGQVASQTLDNIRVIDAVATLPILRPLVGSDKQEIVAEAQALGTYEPSVAAASDDCCTLFMPRRPQTHARPGEAAAGEASLDVDGVVEAAIADATRRELPSASYRPPKRRG